MERVRSAARAVIIRDGRLLLTTGRDERGDWYALPGGGQKLGETLSETVARECREEIGVEVEVGPLLYVRDYIAANHDFSYLGESSHQVEHLFRCHVPKSYEAKSGPKVDTDQVDVAWLHLGELATCRIYPLKLREIVDRENPDLPVYWGDCN